MDINDNLMDNTLFQTLAQYVDDILTCEHHITAFGDGASVCHSLQHRIIGTAVGDVHRQPQLTHPVFHSIQSFNGNFLFSLAVRRYSPHILSQATELLLGVLRATDEQAIVSTADS